MILFWLHPVIQQTNVEPAGEWKDSVPDFTINSNTIFCKMIYDIQSAIFPNDIIGSILL